MWSQETTCELHLHFPQLKQTNKDFCFKQWKFPHREGICETLGTVAGILTTFTAPVKNSTEKQDSGSYFKLKVRGAQWDRMGRVTRKAGLEFSFKPQKGRTATSEVSLSIKYDIHTSKHHLWHRAGMSSIVRISGLFTTKVYTARGKLSGVRLH